MQPQSQSPVTPVASTATGLRRGYDSMLSLPALVALSLDRNGSGLPAFAAQIDADAQPKDDNSLTVEVQAPSDAFGVTFASGSPIDGQLVIVARTDRELLTADERKQTEVFEMITDLFNEDGSVKGAPSDYRTTLLPASPASDDQVLVAIADGEMTEIELPFRGIPEVARISETGAKKARIPAAYVVAERDGNTVLVADESEVINGRPTWTEIARFDAPIAAIARENGSNEVIVQLADGSYAKIERSADGYTVSRLEIEDDSAIPVGSAFLGLTSAYGDGSSHALFARRTAGKPVEMSFVLATKLPAGLFGKQTTAQA